ncbi:hypothetical protein HPB49_012797 [Dermacentor silvarum]|uniref:Uncharacterized protein n=1 Tax=Dermacentor silvarum TaxID=543639 RepID=A0ACB8DD85_DERSI|nr:hypothetical protein HPB49_012797 [Dermacentor silvarum]
MHETSEGRGYHTTCDSMYRSLRFHSWGTSRAGPQRCRRSSVGRILHALSHACPLHSREPSRRNSNHGTSVAGYSSLATLSTSPTPQASRVVLVYLMISLGIPLDGVGMLLHTDWVINRLSTAVNVLGDAVVVSGTQALCRSTLEAPGRDEDGHPE